MSEALFSGQASTEGFSWSDAFLAVQALALVASLVFAYLTVRSSSASRRAEADHFAAMQAAARAEEERARRARLVEVANALAAMEDLRGALLAGKGVDALAQLGPMKVRLQAAVVAVGEELPAMQKYLNAANPVAPDVMIQPAVDELEERIRRPPDTAA